MNNLILSIELVPSSSWFNNVRSNVDKTQWDIIRKSVYSRAYHLCEICNADCKLEAHEIWHFDDESLIQKLEGMIALCPMCHSTKHYGLARIQGREESILKHFIKINNIDKASANRYIDSVFKIWESRSQKEWQLDISILKEYGVEINESNNPGKNKSTQTRRVRSKRKRS